MLPSVSDLVLGLDAAVFDMDGVLVDAIPSYRATIVATVREVVRDVLGGPEPPADLTWPAALKRAGGFNNDWDLTSALVRGWLDAGPGFRVEAFADRLQALGGGLDAVDRLLGPPPAGTTPDGSLLEIFQSIYLGSAARGPGAIERETALVTADELALFRVPRAVATGRPRFEAEYGLRRLGLGTAFGAVVTHDDVVEAGARGKPDPWCLAEAVRRLGGAPERVAYLGDTPDDMRAARAAGFRAIGISAGDVAVRASLNAAGADRVVSRVGELRADPSGRG